MQQSPDLRPPMTIIADKLVKLVESTGLQKISTTQHLEVDAQDPSFITTRPYFEPSSTGISLDSASYFCLSFCHYSYQSIDTLIIFISQSRWNRELHLPVMNARRSSSVLPGIMLPYLVDGTPSISEFSTVAPLSAFLTHANWSWSKLLRCNALTTKDAWNTGRYSRCCQRRKGVEQTPQSSLLFLEKLVQF